MVNHHVLLLVLQEVFVKFSETTMGNYTPGAVMCDKYDSENKRCLEINHKIPDSEITKCIYSEWKEL